MVQAAKNLILKITTTNKSNDILLWHKLKMIDLRKCLDV